ncbi:cobalamin biosynthesis protein CobD [Allobranchiibius sp. CTAmp26]|nr:cobalamin biosynthesis protein CobD [Allobranchiibius sp. CTAmp26]
MLVGYAADLVLGDPRRWHPVAGFGTLATALERRTYAPRRTRGILHEALLVGGVTVAGGYAARMRPHLPVVALATWTVLGGRSLTREASAMHDLLVREDLAGARVQIRHLVGRDSSQLTPAELARACVESVAENGADAVVSPLFWGAIAGVPGLVGYRAVNTLDAMIGHRSQRYREFGWAAARLDDVANWAPARLTVLSIALATGSPARARQVVHVVRRDAPAHPSPNAGPVESAFAAALGRRLGGRSTYRGVPEDRGTLGDGPDVGVDDIGAAIRLHHRTATIALALVVGARVVSRAAARGIRRRS